MNLKHAQRSYSTSPPTFQVSTPNYPIAQIRIDVRILDIVTQTLFYYGASRSSTPCSSQVYISGPIHDFRNIHLVQADADHLPFRKNHFSYVFAFTVLQNLPKPMKTLIEIKRNARHNAIIVITGLKKTFPLKPFKELLGNAGLQVFSLKDDNESKFYVALTINRQAWDILYECSKFLFPN